jgi:polyphosphate kinase
MSDSVPFRVMEPVDDQFAPRFLNRELSWLGFNQRVLSMAVDRSTPLLERFDFLAIHQSNLDEFFQVRVSGLRTQYEAGLGNVSNDGRTPSQQLADIRTETELQYATASRLLLTELLPDLAAMGVEIVTTDDLTDDERSWLDGQFIDMVFPVLTPLAVDPAHPFPYISDLSLNLAVFVADPVNNDITFARVKVPPFFPRFIELPSKTRFVPLEDVIADHLPDLFPGMTIVDTATFRVTRNADITLSDDESEDLLEDVETQLARRRFGEPIRLEVSSDLSANALSFLQRALDVADDEVYVIDGPLALKGLRSLLTIDRSDLKYPSHTPKTPGRLEVTKRAGRSMFSILRDGDVMVHHPYESFADSVDEFIHQAATDPTVLAIKMTMYRTSERTRIVQSLIQAAESGKQVVVVVEITARFDELANIEWARMLERAGVHVAYGVIGLKTHCKLTLVVRQERAGIRRYSHIGTGNYNADTARIYEDIGLFTADQAIGADIGELFNTMTGINRQTSYRQLVVAPSGARRTLIALIESEAAHPDGHVVLKMNSLVDETIIEALYRASQTGCRVDLIVRGVCCLIPGVPGMSDNIEVVSVVGRFLEHSRIFRFGSRQRGYTHLIGSADVMPRNLDGRVEALVPIADENLATRLNEVIARYFDPDAKVWTLDHLGHWTLQAGHDVHSGLISAFEGSPS